jgi:hypothetical protein
LGSDQNVFCGNINKKADLDFNCFSLGLLF